MLGNEGAFDRMIFLYSLPLRHGITKKIYRTNTYFNNSFAFRSSTFTDADFTVALQFNEFHNITQENIIDLIRDLDLLKNKTE